MPFYSGAAHRRTEWRFKVENRKRTLEFIADKEAKAQNMANLVTQVIDGLSDEAFKIAMDMCEEQLGSPDAIETLITLMSDHVAKYKPDEARELYKAGSRMSFRRAHELVHRTASAVVS